MHNRFIERLSALSPLTDKEVAALSDAMVGPRQFDAKCDLIREGDRPGPVFVVLDGWVCRYKILPNGSRQILAYLLPGDNCDLHVGLLAEMDHSIQTITPALIATIGREDMDTLFREHPGIAKAMYLGQLIGEGTMRAWITSIGRRSSIQRVAHLMCEMYLRARSVGLTLEGEFSLPLSQAMLADSMGMTNVHINRVLRELKDCGVMSLRRGSLVINDPDGLAMIAGFDENYLHRERRTLAASTQ